MSSGFANCPLVGMKNSLVLLFKYHCSRATQTWLISLFTSFVSVTLSKDLTALSLNFLLCKIEIIALPNLAISRRIKLDNTYKALTTSLAASLH